MKNNEIQINPYLIHTQSILRTYYLFSFLRFFRLVFSFNITFQELAISSLQGVQLF